MKKAPKHFAEDHNPSVHYVALRNDHTWDTDADQWSVYTVDSDGLRDVFADFTDELSALQYANARNLADVKYKVEHD